MEDERYKKLGIEKRKEFDKDFDQQYAKYKKLATELGFEGDLKFVKEHWKVIVYVSLNI
jgi:sulfur relay (sulfurtransferase) DsrC/TusE family protein